MSGREVDQGARGREVEVCGGCVVGAVLADGPRPREVRSCESFRDGVAGWEYHPGSCIRPLTRETSMRRDVEVGHGAWHAD